MPVGYGQDCIVEFFAECEIHDAVLVRVTVRHESSAGTGIKCALGEK